MDALVLVISTVLLGAAHICGETCGVAEEGTSFAISQTCDTNIAGASCAFVQQADGSYDYLTACLPSGCTSLKPNKYLFNKTNDIYTLTVISVSRVDLKPFIFLNNGNPVWQCDLSVYAKPESPTCDPPSYSPGKNVSVKCSTPKSFPEAKCVVKLQGQQSELPGVIYSYSDASSGGLQYNSTTCELNHTVSGPGSYSFDVDMFVTINNTRYGTVSTNTGPINLTLPRVNPSLDCPKGDEVKDGYIKTGFTATCTCRRGDRGNPEGRVRWYDSSGLVVNTPDTDGGSSTLTLTQTGAANYSCKADSDLGIQTQIVTFTPKFAIGPTLVNVSKDSNDPVDLCPGSTPTVTVHCSVPVSDVNPYPVFAVYSDSQDEPTTRNNGTNIGQVYSYMDTVNLTSGGFQNLMCITQNVIFNDIKTLNSSKIYVRAPPLSAPVLEVKVPDKTYTESSNETVTVPVNSTITVTCHVDDGHPNVSSVNLTCGTNNSVNLTRETNSTSAVSGDLLFTSTTEKDEVFTCSCTAKHVTNCYVNNTSNIMLSINVTSKSVENNKASEQNDDESTVAAIAGGVAAGVLVILVVILVVFILRRKGIIGDPKKRDEKLTSVQSSPSDDEEHVTENIIYGTQPVRSSETVVDNSYIYNMNKNDEVVVDNSFIYNMNKNDGGRASSMYKAYTDVVPTITSAAAMPPKNMNTRGNQGSDRLYEDVGGGLKSSKSTGQSKPPKPATKPKPAASTPGKQTTMTLTDDGLDQTYASVIKPLKAKSTKPAQTTKDEDVFFQDESKMPEVPEKNFEKLDKNQENKNKKKEKDKENETNKRMEQGDADRKGKNRTGSPYEDVNSTGDSGLNPYTNDGFSGTEDEVNVYANTGRTSDVVNNNDSDIKKDSGRYRNKDGLLYTTVEIISSPADDTTSRRPKIVDEGIQYSTLQFK